LTGKTKVQISTVVKERDTASNLSDNLKQQLNTLKAEVETLRQARDSERSRWEQDQRQKDLARAELQDRLDSLKQRKSKLNVRFFLTCCRC
jgi:chromosome segregation ATPase